MLNIQLAKPIFVTMSININESGFFHSLKQLTLESYIDSLAAYRQSFNDALNLESTLPIFLDTNVLLRYYSASFTSRSGLLDFFNNYSDRFFLTNQVQIEFVRNRENIINIFFDETLEKLKTSFQSDILNKLKTYHDSNKKLMGDFPFLDESLIKVMKELQRTYNLLSKDIDSREPTIQKTKYDDKLLEVIKRMHFINNLQDEEIIKLKEQFKLLSKDLTAANVTNEIKKPQKAFPGAGDIKQKPEDPYGDYIIYHEIIKYMKQNGTDAIFLTYDTTKGDWLDEEKEAHSHYVQSCYSTTGKLLFFVDAERYFEDKLQTHFSTLIPSYNPNKQERDEIVKDLLMKFIDLEGLIRNIVDLLYLSFDKKPIMFILRELHNRETINSEIFRETQKLYQLRSLFIHEPNNITVSKMSMNDLYRLMHELDQQLYNFNDIQNEIIEAYN